MAERLWEIFCAFQIDGRRHTSRTVFDEGVNSPLPARYLLSPPQPGAAFTLVLLLEDDMQTSRLRYYARATMNEDTPEIRAKNRLPWRSADDAIVCFNVAATQVSL